MGRILIPGLPEAEPAAEPWPVDEYTIRVDEMFARQLDTEFSAGVRGVLHDPETGVSAQRGEAALEAIAGAMPALGELKERTLAQAIGPRQRSILEPLIETRLDWAAGTLGRLAQRAMVEVDDASVADRIAGLNQDAATAWQDPAYLRRLGRTAVEELRYQGERRGWDATETDTRVRTGLSDLYVGAVETAIRQDDLDGASALYDYARPVIDPERQAALDRRFVQAREAAVYRDVDRDMAGIPIEPEGPPGVEVFAKRAAELRPRMRATGCAPASARSPPRPSVTPSGSGTSNRPRPELPPSTGSGRTPARQCWRYRRTSATGWRLINGAASKLFASTAASRPTATSSSNSTVR